LPALTKRVADEQAHRGRDLRHRAPDDAVDVDDLLGRQARIEHVAQSPRAREVALAEAPLGGVNGRQPERRERVDSSCGSTRASAAISVAV
jgi:hypothetical protein